MERSLSYYEATRRRLIAFGYVEWLIDWDQNVTAPKSSGLFRSQQVRVIANEIHQISSDPAYIASVKNLYVHRSDLPKDLQVEIKKVYKELRIIEKVPKKEYIDYQVLLSTSSQIWAQAKKENNFEIFLPTLEKIIAYQRRLVKFIETDALKGYDVLLDMFEEGMTTKEYDLFFEELKVELVPFMMESTRLHKVKFNKKLKYALFPKDKQIEFSEYLVDIFGFDRSRGVIAESLHPFTSGVSAYDIRLTTDYEEDNFTSAFFSTIHELGHAIYEQQNDPDYDDTRLHGGSSFGIHESQSRMFENMFGRSYAFWEAHYPKLVSLFPKQLKGISLDEFHQYINQPKRTLVRVDADELTYPLHIMVRYEIEKELINGHLKPKDINKKWKQLMAKYIGIRPVKDNDGALQDIHWALGSFGYFPTYALGSAYAAQIYDAMCEDLDINQLLRSKNMRPINHWLKQHIHRFGKSKTPQEIILMATKKPFSPAPYIKYLKEKFKY